MAERSITNNEVINAIVAAALAKLDATFATDNDVAGLQGQIDAIPDISTDPDLSVAPNLLTTRSVIESAISGFGSSLYHYRQTTTPSNPAEGQLWFDTSTGRSFIRQSSQWVEVEVLPSGLTLANADDRYNHVGIGSPLGVLAADPGTRYVDQASTNGARVWTKASGTSTSGWVVAEGDTGWRLIASASQPNGWTNLETASNGLQIRRVDNTVEVTGVITNSAAATSDVFYVAESGFRPRYIAMGSCTQGLDSRTAYGAMRIASNGELRAIERSGVASAFVYVGASWTTTNAWPTTLPGTAV